MNRFINREDELKFLNEQYSGKPSALVIIYGRRRVGKTSLIHEFIKDKPFVYFLASEEAENLNIRMLRTQIEEYTGNASPQTGATDWDTPFKTLAKHIGGKRLVLVLDEFQYLGKTNAAFPSVFQRIWDKYLQNQNIMVILCGSLTHMMENQTLNYNSPLYGRRTGQIKLRQIDFNHYHEFFEGLSYRDLIEHYAVTGGVPKYIELFTGESDLFSKIEQSVLNRQSFLFEEPLFLLQNEVAEVGSYFSVIKSIAAGNRRLSKICTDLEIKQATLLSHLKTLTDLDILERETPVTETNPEKSKTALYRIKDNFLSFWFKFIYPEKARLEIGDISHVTEKIKNRFIENHTAFVYEAVCHNEMWRLNAQGKLNFNKLGRWWNNHDEIDIVGIDTGGNEIIFGECKYQNKPTDTDVFETLLRKKDAVVWKNGKRKESFTLFSISGFTERLKSLAASRGDLVLFNNPVQ